MKKKINYLFILSILFTVAEIVFGDMISFREGGMIVLFIFGFSLLVIMIVYINKSIKKSKDYSVKDNQDIFL